MLKTIAKKAVLFVLFGALFFSAFVPPVSAAMQQDKTIILDMGSASSDDIKDMQYGEGKLYKRIAKYFGNLQEAGEIDDNAQAVIVIVKKKSSSSF